MKFALVVCFAALVACEPEAKPEAKADPWLTYGYSGLYHGYAGYPYAAHSYYYGKRSAEAEPEANADVSINTQCQGLSLTPHITRLCTATTVMVPGPTTDWDTEVTDMEDTEVTTMDKFPASEAQSRSSKRTSLLVI